MSENQPTGRTVYTVSRLNREVRQLLEDEFPLLWVEGELSNLARPASGHVYFSLKDDRTQVRCAMWRSQVRKLSFQPEAGQQVLVRARVGLYEARGDFQLIVESMEDAGEGDLRRRFEALKKKLDEEGLFASSRKRKPPRLPASIGVVTSPSGAAVRDILHVLARRFPAVPVIVYPTTVQGEAAAGQIAQALDSAAARGDCEVLILARGGGSLEDLWAYNEEVVARALDRCTLPVISGVGHEVDVTIADLVADVRAPTPSGAAELAVPDRAEWLARIGQLQHRALGGVRRHALYAGDRWQGLKDRLVRNHPGNAVAQNRQRLDDLIQRGFKATQQTGRLGQVRLDGLSRRLAAAAPLMRFARLGDQIAALLDRLALAQRHQAGAAANRLGLLSARLDAVSPLRTLDRGYAIVTDVATGAVLRDAGEVVEGADIEARLARGRVSARVTRTTK